MSALSIEALNSECFCLGVDAQALHAKLDDVLGAYGLPEALAVSHPHLFSALPVYVSRRRIERAAKVVAAIEEVTALPTWPRKCSKVCAESLMGWPFWK